ncbi:hypothetical protein [Pedobacter sp. Leaf194]|uniref:hypothetical protein n=1 Tax=Pedobacter sp. Leaf194 TaxID=1736297 RepID=UPI000702FD4C|nr:hypothetical protein [Pedobacter sp. Leaf194]KQS36859.1 hypothetical protein ASG14_07425 [Pedobacter sp. Leaf194]
MRSNDVIFIAGFGNEHKVVKLTSSNGRDGNIYHIMMDNYYSGMIIKRLKWDVCFQIYTDEYTQAEVDTLIGRVSGYIDITDL